ncbi:hypothetical protein B0H14DRAFT_2564088 [Mycena olivaceomarginata]|nr:hypothetical protein B0H14DRAFT_2564088 [Mycena olivaceomarginata]
MARKRSNNLLRGRYFRRRRWQFEAGMTFLLVSEDAQVWANNFAAQVQLAAPLQSVPTEDGGWVWPGTSGVLDSGDVDGSSWGRVEDSRLGGWGLDFVVDPDVDPSADGWGLDTAGGTNAPSSKSSDGVAASAA